MGVPGKMTLGQNIASPTGLGPGSRAGIPALVRQFLTFAVVGGVSTACHFAVLFALHEWARIGVVAGTSCGAAVGAIVNYLLNRRITFAASAGGSGAIPRFALVAITGLALNSASMAVLEQLVPQVHYLLRQCAVTGLVLLYSFTMNKFWTFRHGAAGRATDAA